MYSTRHIRHLELWLLAKEYIFVEDSEIRVTPKWKIGKTLKGSNTKKSIKRNKQKPAYKNYRVKK